MAIPLEKREGYFTYGDYLVWPDEERWELIEGIAYAMSPAPGRWHQQYLGNLFFQFFAFFEGKACKVFSAPFDVRLPAFPDQLDGEIDTVVQPDLCVVCDKAKLDDRGCRGAPDLAVEVLSPSTAVKDLREKFSLYERQRVREFWILHPAEKLVQIFLLDGSGSYGKPKVFAAEDAVPSAIFEGLVIDLKKVFAE